MIASGLVPLLFCCGTAQSQWTGFVDATKARCVIPGAEVADQKIGIRLDGDVAQADAVAEHRYLPALLVHVDADVEVVIGEVLRFVYFRCRVRHTRGGLEGCFHIMRMFSPRKVPPAALLGN